MRILLAEDDRDLSSFVQEGFAQVGYSLDLAYNGKDALHMVSEQLYDAILLDVMMPEIDGYAVLRRLRSLGNKLPIIMLTCKGQERDKLQGLDGGADDYMVKPFLISELIARIRAILRRTEKLQTHQGTASVIKIGPIQMDILKREVKRGTKVLTLTKKEFDLLEYFMRKPGQVLSQAILAQHLFQADFNTNTNGVEVHVKNLRSKIDGPSTTQSLIRTVRGCGYALDVK